MKLFWTCLAFYLIALPETVKCAETEPFDNLPYILGAFDNGLIEQDTRYDTFNPVDVEVYEKELQKQRQNALFNELSEDDFSLDSASPTSTQDLSLQHGESSPKQEETKIEHDGIVLEHDPDRCQDLICFECTVNRQPVKGEPECTITSKGMLFNPPNPKPCFVIDPYKEDRVVYSRAETRSLQGAILENINGKEYPNASTKKPKRKSYQSLRSSKEATTEPKESEICFTRENSPTSAKSLPFKKKNLRAKKKPTLDLIPETTLTTLTRPVHSNTPSFSYLDKVTLEMVDFSTVSVEEFLYLLMRRNYFGMGPHLPKLTKAILSRFASDGKFLQNPIAWATCSLDIVGLKMLPQYLCLLKNFMDANYLKKENLLSINLLRIAVYRAIRRAETNLTKELKQLVEQILLKVQFLFSSKSSEGNDIEYTTDSRMIFRISENADDMQRHLSNQHPLLTFYMYCAVLSRDAILVHSKNKFLLPDLNDHMSVDYLIASDAVRNTWIRFARQIIFSCKAFN